MEKVILYYYSSLVTVMCQSYLESNREIICASPLPSSLLHHLDATALSVANILSRSTYSSGERAGLVNNARKVGVFYLISRERALVINPNN